MMDYRAIAEAADMRVVAASVGLEVDVRGKALCPFHDDTRPSMQVYPDGFHCFVCGAHGDAIDLVQQIRGCTRHEAAQEVARVAGCDTAAPAPPRRSVRREAAQQYDVAQDIFLEADRQIAIARGIMDEVEPYSVAYVYAAGQVDHWMLIRELADQMTIEARFKAYDEKHKRGRTSEVL